jgi:hypothetical protein
MFDIPQTTALPQLRSLSLGPTRSAPVLVFGAYRSRLLDRPIAVAGDPQQSDSAGDQVLAGKLPISLTIRSSSSPRPYTVMLPSALVL